MRYNNTGLHFDEFKEEGSHFFLSHFHSDHTKGLGRNWRRGKLYASVETRKLLHSITKLNEKYITPVYPLENIDIIEKGKNYTITPIPANHCIGALMYKIKTNNKTALFTGDFRFNEELEPYLNYFMDIDELYLDTTYLDPRYKFPSQKECINNVIKVINEHPEKKIIFGSYSIGKEKLLLKVFENFARQIYSPGEKIRYYRAMGVDYAFTDKKENARFSVYNMPVLGHFYKRLENSDFIIIVPRGFGVDRKSIPGKVYYIPYSEHSSYDELIHFLDIVKTDKIYDLTGKPVTFQKELC